MSNIEDNRLIIGEKIRQRRMELGYTQEKLAELLNYSSKSAINKIEKGINDFPKSKLILFAKVLKTDVNYFLSDDDTTKIKGADIYSQHYEIMDMPQVKEKQIDFYPKKKMTKEEQKEYDKIEKIIFSCFGEETEANKKSRENLRNAIKNAFLSDISAERKSNKK